MGQTPGHLAQETQTRRMQFAASLSIVPFPALNGPKFSRVSSVWIARRSLERHRPNTFGFDVCECNTTASASKAGDAGWTDIWPRSRLGGERFLTFHGYRQSHPQACGSVADRLT